MENHIFKFFGYNNAKDRLKKTIDKNYDKLISGYEDAEPLNVRMKTINKYIESVEIVGEDKAKTMIIYTSISEIFP